MNLKSLFFSRLKSPSATRKWHSRIGPAINHRRGANGGVLASSDYASTGKEITVKHQILSTTVALLLAAGAVPWSYAATSLEVGEYAQDVATHFTSGSAAKAVAVAVDGKGHVFAATPDGVFEYSDGNWVARAEGSAGAIVGTANGVIAVQGDSLVSVAAGGTASKIGAAPNGVTVLAVNGDTIYAGGSEGLFAVEKGQGHRVESVKGSVLALASGPNGVVAAGTAEGLFVNRGSGTWEALTPSDATGRSWALRDVKAVAIDGSGRLWFGSPQGAGRLENDAWTLYTGDEGLPYNQFSGAACGPNGEVWFATTKGAIRFENGDFNYRQGKRWVPNDDVRAVAVASDGSAWFATAGGVGTIARTKMTLADKAKYYEDQIDKYNRRTEYGYVLEATVEVPGDADSGHRNHDSDNDGLWTSMYGAGECFAYGATQDPKAKERAKKAFEALRFLSVAPIDGEVKQQPGYVARTVLPTTEPDPNKRPSYTLEGQKENQKGDSLWKAYVPRWPLTKDKKYWYKTDTSSDELDGHYFFYAAYYDLVADTEEEKARVREVVVNVTDHLMRNDFCLIDHDGKPTRWAVYSPRELNRNPLWSWERGLNSLSMLSYLTVAEHMTGDSKYTDAIKVLREEHAYDVNAINSKLQQGFGSGNQSDDEMAVMCFYNIAKYTKDADLKKRMQYAFYRYMSFEWPEMNPLFNFAYAAVGQGATFTNAFGEWKIDPWDGWLEDSIDTLKRFPLDRFNWAHENAHRLDITLLPRQQRIDPVEPASELERTLRGYRRVTGKVIPVDERHFNHWNTDPWNLNYGGNGTGLADGAVFLLPYYMGLYHGFIK